MKDPAVVLCIGYDAQLLNIRSRVLATRFAGVLSCQAGDVRDMLHQRRIDLFILCHTIPATLCTQTMSLLREFHPGTPILSLYTGTSGCNPLRADAAVPALDGPLKLLRSVELVLHLSPAQHAMPPQTARPLF